MFFRLSPKIAAVGLAVLLISGPALAQGLTFYEKDGWSGNAVRGADGRFQGCNVSTVPEAIGVFGARQRSDWRIGLAHFADGTWAFLLARVSKPFKSGLQYDVTLTVDGAQVFAGRSKVTDNGLAFLAPPLSEATVSALSDGHQLDYATRRGRVSLSLAGSADAIEAARDCVRHYISGAAVASSRAPEVAGFEARGAIACAVAPPNPDRRLILSLNVRDAPYGNIRGQVRFGDVVYRRPNAPRQVDDSSRSWEVVHVERDGDLIPVGYVFVDYLDCRPGAAEASKERAGRIIKAAFEDFYARHPHARQFENLLIEEVVRAQSEFPDADLPQHLSLALPAATARFRAGESVGSRNHVPEERHPKKPSLSTGTGFFVSSAGHVLTNAHVAGECKRLLVGQPGSKPVAAELVNVDPVNDLALLKTPLQPTRIARIKPTVRTGEEVAIYGFPYFGSLPSTGNFVLGNISATAGMRNDPRHLQTSAPVQPGNSGGPLVDRSGNVLGVVVARLGASVQSAAATVDVPQNVNFAVKGLIARGFLDANLIDTTDPDDSQALPPADLADVTKEFTVFIVCQN